MELKVFLDSLDVGIKKKKEREREREMEDISSFSTENLGGWCY